MKDIMRDELGAPKIVDRSAFQAELDALRVPVPMDAPPPSGLALRPGIPTIWALAAADFVPAPQRLVCAATTSTTSAERGPYRSLPDWARPRNMHDKGGMVEANGRYHQSGCACQVHLNMETTR